MPILQDTTFPPVPEDPQIKFPWVFLMRCSLVTKLHRLEEQGVDPIEYLSAALEERFKNDETLFASKKDLKKKQP